MKTQRIMMCLPALLLAGCAQIPPLNFSPKDVPAMTKKVDGDLRSVVVVVAQDREKTGDIDFNMNYSKTVPDLWKEGLEDALNRSLAFADESPRKLNVRVKILKFDTPAFGASMHTNVTAYYEIQDRASGEVVFSQEVSSVGTVEASYAFAGAVRAIESANRAVQNNILAFLVVLREKCVSPSIPKQG